MPESVSADRRLLTLGQIAQQLGVSIHRAKYAIESYRIEPVTRIGIMRVWSEDDLPRIKSAIARVASNRGGGR